ncbi:MAG: SPOR domain-containing protein, partial [Quisquiliibacterium sp.]
SSPAPAVPDSPSQANAAAAAAKSPPAAPAPAPTAKPVDDPIARLARSREAQNPAPTDKATGFIVQVGAYATEKGATEQIERTQKAGYKAYRESVKPAQGERIRVRIGPYASRAQADQVRAKLRTAGIESVLIAP